MDELCTNAILRNITTIPDILEVKRYEYWAFRDFTNRKRKGDCSLMRSRFRSGNYSFSLLSAERDEEIVAILHQENIDPRFLVKSLLDPNQRRCSVSTTRRTEYHPAAESRNWWEEFFAANFNGLFCFIKQRRVLNAKGFEFSNLLFEYSLLRNGIYKMQLGNETLGVAIDPTDVFGDAEVSSTLFDDDDRLLGGYYALAFHKTVSDSSVSGEAIPIESVLYEDVYRSFCHSGEHIENAYYCLDATTDGANFSILPDNIFVKILLNLPCRRRISSRRVNKRWMTLCNVTVSLDTKIIREHSQQFGRVDTMDQFRRMDTKDLWRLLPIVCGCLEGIRWQDLLVCGGGFNRCVPAQMLLQIPAFPNLRIIAMAGDDVPDYGTFFSLLDKCPNLRVLMGKIPTPVSTDYSPGTYQVEKLIVPRNSSSDYRHYGDGTNDLCLTEITNRFPRLSYFRCNDISATAYELSSVIGKYGENLVHLQIRCMERWLRSNAVITGMETCHNLEYLELSSAGFLSDAVMKDIANGCQKLSTLVITNCDNVTNEGLTVLASLPNLKQLNISDIKEEFSFGISQIAKDFSLGISEIAKEGRLEQLIAVRVDLSPTCLKACVRYCRRLKLLDVTCVSDLTLEDAKEIIHLFNGWSLSPCLLFSTDYEVWDNSEIKQLLEEQSESGHRQFIVQVRGCDAHDFIRDDESTISTDESTDLYEDWPVNEYDPWD